MATSSKQETKRRHKRRETGEVVVVLVLWCVGFMSSRSGSVVVIVVPHSSVKLWLFVHSRVLLCCFLQHKLRLGSSSVSMRLRPKRTCCGVECFGGFHIERSSSPYLFFRETLT